MGLVVVMEEDRRTRQVEFSLGLVVRSVLLKNARLFLKTQNSFMLLAAHTKQTENNKKRIERCQKFEFRFRFRPVHPVFAVVETFLPCLPVCRYLFPVDPLPSTPVLLQNWKVELPFSF
jgi:hypothetical protein